VTIGKREAVLAVIAEHPDRRLPTALATQIGAAADARLSRAVIEDFADRFGKPEAACSLLWCVPPKDAADFAAVTGGAGEIAAVDAADAGAHWNASARAAFDRGFTHVALMALDAPHVPNDDIYTALGQVDQYGLAFGAGDRGTFYLAAINEPTDLFTDIDFDGPEAATDLLVAASKRGLSCAPLVGNFSVRDAADLKRLAAYFGRHKRVDSKRTQKVVAEIIASFQAEENQSLADHKGRPHNAPAGPHNAPAEPHNGPAEPHSQEPADHEGRHYRPEPRT
jgi:glycosyltransferase A (GT-A) superfamily protein (DUF2064 family)